MKNVTPNQQTMLATWQQHTYAEFVLKDADAALSDYDRKPPCAPYGVWGRAGRSSGRA
jgi:hypothetical protein